MRRLWRGGSGRGLRVMAVTAAMMLLAACATIYRNHGYVPAEDELATLVIGKDTRESVAEKIGRPTAQGLLNDVGWFYVQSRFEHYGPYEPKEIDRQIVAVTFSPNGVLQNVSRYGLEHGRVVTISRRVTESNIREINVIRMLLGNIGRVRADDLLN